jgi:hypothetical protein
MLTGVEITAAIAGIRNLRDLVATLKDSAEKRKLAAAIEDVQDKIISLQGKMLEAQQAIAAAEQRARAAEQKCMELEDFRREAERYALTELTPGFFVYALKPGMEQGEPAHSLCATCFAKHQKSIVQRTDTPGRAKIYSCQNCGAQTMKAR